MLEDLGIYGMQSIEIPLVAGLAAGEPVLLVGSHGTAKTTLCRQLARAMGWEFWAYDASKALFEDIIGFPDPHSLKDGEVAYVSTPVSVWGKECVLVDELSRAAPSMQNKWLEVIRSRRIMGKELPDLEQVFAAMNPPSYLGAHPLDEALAGRFALVLRIPEVSRMAPEDVRRVAENVTEDDGFSYQVPNGGTPFSSLPPIVDSVRRAIPAWEEANGEALSNYTVALEGALRSHNVTVDGRRLGMVRRMLRACLCAEAVLSGSRPLPLKESSTRLAVYLPHTLPFEASDRPVHRAALEAAHRAAFAAACTGRPSVLPDDAGDPILTASRYLRDRDHMEPVRARGAVTRIIAAAANGKTELESRSEPIAALALLASGVTEDGAAMCQDDQFRVLDAFRGIYEPSPDGENGMQELCECLFVDGPHQPYGELDPERALAARASCFTPEEDRPGSKGTRERFLESMRCALARAVRMKGGVR